MKTGKRIVSILLVALLLLTAAPLAGFVGLEIAPKAKAYSVGDQIQFGTYPQSRVKETPALQAAADAASWKSYNYYTGTGNQFDGNMKPDDFMMFADFFCEGEKYRAVKFTEYRPYHTGTTSYGDQYRNGYYRNTVYYFHYWSLTWKVLDPSSGLILCDNIVDSQAYQNTVYKVGNEFYQTKDSSIFANNYALSSIRNWLNYDFYETAFSDSQKNNIISTTLNNDAIDSYMQYNSPATVDKVFLLSYEDVVNNSYGFPSGNGTHLSRRAFGTSYADCQGLEYLWEGSIRRNPSWSLRTPGASGSMCLIQCNGNISSGSINYTVYGIRPACCLATLKNDVEVSTYLFSNSSVHTHNYASSITTQPTCGVPGVRTYTCSCGDTYAEEIPALTHTDNNKDGKCDYCGTIMSSEKHYGVVTGYGKSGNLINCLYLSGQKYNLADQIEESIGKTLLHKCIEYNSTSNYLLEYRVVPYEIMMDLQSVPKQYRFSNGQLYDIDTGEKVQSVCLNLRLKMEFSEDVNYTPSESEKEILAMQALSIQFNLKNGFLDSISGASAFSVDSYKLTFGNWQDNFINVKPNALDSFLQGESLNKLVASVKMEYQNAQNNTITCRDDFRVDFLYPIVYGQDNFDFLNRKLHFVASGEEDRYLISKEARKKISKPYYIDIDADSVFKWNGSCYGMSCMISSFLSNPGVHTIEKSSFGAANVFEMNAPVKNSVAQNIKLRDAINIVQCSNATLPRLSNVVNVRSQKEWRKNLVAAVKNIDNGGMLPVVDLQELLIMSPSHAVVAYSVTEDAENYHIRICDPNSIEKQPREMTISKDFSKMMYPYDHVYVGIKAVTTESSFWGLNEVAPDFVSASISTGKAKVPSLNKNSTNDKLYEFTAFSVQNFNEIKIENDIGEYAVINQNNGQTAGTLKTDIVIEEGVNPIYQVLVYDSATNKQSYTVTSTSGNFALKINHNNVIGSYTGSTTDAVKIQYQSDGEMNVESSSSNQYEMGLYQYDMSNDICSAKVSGTGKSAGLLKTSDGIVVASDTLSGDQITVGHFDESRTQEDLRQVKSVSGHSALIATDSKGTTTLFTDDDNDGYYTDIVPSHTHADADNDGYCDTCEEMMTGGQHCKYCGKIHGGLFGWLVKFFHSIFAIFKR